jgi:hypothetical protein
VTTIGRSCYPQATIGDGDQSVIEVSSTGDNVEDEIGPVQSRIATGEHEEQRCGEKAKAGGRQVHPGTQEDAQDRMLSGGKVDPIRQFQGREIRIWKLGRSHLSRVLELSVS